ncbi:DEKNAAC104078 [Brettanomyces naardenensis]|uniref:DEKNAAC104078 n=1 Tax=Brettanomyces naardenensis TaxID=13370 RepID=A0A448YQ46_BRENA|nr:DEKNAAC104078 [Brettanomyces naardenensis]
MLLPTLTSALPIRARLLVESNDMGILKKPPLTDTEYWTYMISSMALVLLGGVFSGLTLGLMGQDEVHLKVVAQSGSVSDRKAANTVLDLLSKGKHWLLVTLLLANVITNETLPVILDRFLGGGAAAVFGSTVLIVIFGEILPQSVCVRYGLQIGAFFSNFVEVLMYIMYPVAYPIAKILDWSLGQDHGVLYGKSGLKTLVNLHHTRGVERLSQDEVTIINAVLDLKDKAVGEVMTPIQKVFTLPSDTILDEAAVEEIFNAGFSRIPIHLPGEPTNFVGMLLVRILISYDPEDALPVSTFPLATLPETGYYTSCLNILNYFQEGKSHMVVVSETPGMDTGAKGVVTLEDVIEELIGEEIVDESDVYVDVDRNIKRSIPGPLAKRNVVHYLHDLYNSNHDGEVAVVKSSATAPDRSDGEIPREGSQGSYILKKDFEQSLAEKRAREAAEGRPPPLGPDDSHRKKVEPSKVEAPLSPQLSTLGTVITKGIKPSNLAANPLHTNNEHITIKKQPKMEPTAETLRKLSQDHGIKGPEEADETADSKTNLLDMGTKIDYGSSHSSIDQIPGVYDTEVSAFVKGVKDNEQRSKTRNLKTRDTTPGRSERTPPQTSDRSLSIGSNDSDGIIESSIVTGSGFKKTVIEESSIPEQEEMSNEEADDNDGIRMGVGKRIRRSSRY